MHRDQEDLQVPQVPLGRKVNKAQQDIREVLVLLALSGRPEPLARKANRDRTDFQEARALLARQDPKARQELQDRPDPPDRSAFPARPEPREKLDHRVKLIKHRLTLKLTPNRVPLK